VGQSDRSFSEKKMAQFRAPQSIHLEDYGMNFRQPILFASLLLANTCCAAGYRNKIKQVATAAKAGDFVAFKNLTGLSHEKAEQIFASMRDQSRIHNTSDYWLPEVERPPRTGDYCAVYSLSNQPLRDNYAVTLTGSYRYYFFFSADNYDGTRVTDIVDGGSTDLGKALGGVFAHRSYPRSPSLETKCGWINRAR